MEQFWNDTAAFLTLDRCLEITGFLIGLLYLYWEYHADPRMWFANIAMPTVSFWVYYRAGLYADFAMNCYYFVMAVYGYLAWTLGFRRRKRGGGLPVRHLGVRRALGALAAGAVVYALLAYWLVEWTDSNVPWWDAFTTAMSIVATWMLARKYLEQWWAWIAVDAVCVGLYIYKDRPFYAVLYAIYTVIALFGYAKWRRIMAAQSAPLP